MKVCVVGRGKVGSALARAAKRAGLELRTTAGRAPSARALRGAELIVLAVPDAHIDAVGLAVARLAPGAAIAHTAGARGPDALARAQSEGAPVAAMHPLVSFADPARPPRLEGALFLLDGDRAAVALARRFARALGARAVTLPVHRPTYHAAAALAANGAAALAHHAVRVLRGLGLDERSARAGVASLLESVAENVRSLGVPEALTGPIARGDEASVRAHRAALAADPEALAVYDGVAPAVLSCARAAGLSAERARAVERALGEALTPPRKRRSPRRSAPPPPRP